MVRVYASNVGFYSAINRVYARFFPETRPRAPSCPWLPGRWSSTSRSSARPLRSDLQAPPTGRRRAPVQCGLIATSRLERRTGRAVAAGAVACHVASCSTVLQHRLATRADLPPWRRSWKRPSPACRDPSFSALNDAPLSIEVSIERRRNRRSGWRRRAAPGTGRLGQESGPLNTKNAPSAMNRKPIDVIEGQPLAEVQHRKDGEDQERDHLLHGLQLRRRVDGMPLSGWLGLRSNIRRTRWPTRHDHQP